MFDYSHHYFAARWQLFLFFIAFTSFCPESCSLVIVCLFVFILRMQRQTSLVVVIGVVVDIDNSPVTTNVPFCFFFVAVDSMGGIFQRYLSSPISSPWKRNHCQPPTLIYPVLTRYVCLHVTLVPLGVATDFMLTMRYKMLIGNISGFLKKIVGM